MRVGTSNATLGGNPMVGFHVFQGVEEVKAILPAVTTWSGPPRVGFVRLPTEYRGEDSKRLQPAVRLPVPGDTVSLSTRPRGRVRRSKRDATRLSATRVLHGVEWRNPTVTLLLASGPASRVGFEQVSPTRRVGVQARPQRARQREQAGVVDKEIAPQYDVTTGTRVPFRMIRSRARSSDLWTQ